MAHVEGEVLRQLRRLRVGEKRAHESLRLVARDHAAAARRDRHCACAAEDLELDGRALDARDAERHSAIVDFVVAVVLQECVRDLRQT